ncbi:MAG: hypothetical protein QXM96_03385 [Candidatus Woesearchaeota archaeon]
MKTIVIIAGIIVLLLAVISARNILMNDFNITEKNGKNIDNNVKNIANTNLNNIKDQEFGFQKVKLLVNSNGDYELQPGVLKKDVPVKMEVDLNSVYGCARSIVIKDFNVFKNVRQGDNIIEFTPTKEGRIRIQCSMNMYSGYFDVVSDSKINELKTEAYEKNSLNNDINTDNNENLENSNQNEKTINQNTKIGCGCGGRF